MILTPSCVTHSNAIKSDLDPDTPGGFMMLLVSFNQTLLSQMKTGWRLKRLISLKMKMIAQLKMNARMRTVSQPIHSSTLVLFGLLLGQLIVYSLSCIIHICARWLSCYDHQ